MKIIIYTIVMLFGYGITYGFCSLVLPSWIAVDLMLILIVCIAQSTEDYTAGIIGLASGAIIDIFISPAFGLNTLIYASIGYFYAMFSAKLKRGGLINAMIATFVFFLLRDFVYALYGIVYGSGILYFGMIWRMSLLSGLINCGICVPVYFINLKLHELSSLKKRRNLDLLRGYNEQIDWFEDWFEKYK